MLIVLFLLVAHWYLDLFSQSFFLHRYAAHRSFTMSKGWERFFYFFCYVMQGSAFISPRAYAITHRMHHAFTDTPQDPHSPVHQNTVWKMMWRTRMFVLDILLNRMEIDPKFSRNVPDWPAFDFIANSIVSRILWVGIYIAMYRALGVSPWIYGFAVPIHAVMGPIQAAIINWHSHVRGYKSYEVSNESRNLMRIDIFFLGEAYHNNHHKFPAAVNMAMGPREFDPIYHIVRLFDKMGIVRIVKKPAMAAQHTSLQESKEAVAEF